MCVESQYSPNCVDAHTMAALPKVKIAYSPEPKGGDVREMPLYSLAEVAYFIGIPKTTLHRWVRKFKSKKGPLPPLINIADPTNAMFSFFNLAEAHILSVTVRIHGIRLRTIRDAIDEMKVENLTNPEHPLLSREFYTDGVDLFVKHLQKRINVSQFGQLGLREIVDSYLQRIERDEEFKPTKLYPAKQTGKVVCILPTVSSGRPVIDGTGIPVASVWNRYQAGDDVELLAEDYEIPEVQIEGAIQYAEQLRVAA
jgi:uncharacterized protein (DUF433 family)